MVESRLRWAVAALALLAIAAPMAFAADEAPPAWRGQSGTTFQQWNFASDANPAAPELANNPYGAPSAAITVGDFGSGWQNQLDGMGNATGYWDLGSAGTMVFDIPNTADPVPFTEVWIQVTCFVDITDVPAVSVANGTEIDGEMFITEDVETGGFWVLSQSLWQVQPSSGSNIITLTGDPDWGAVVDSVVVDTRAAVVPEPASMTALLFGAVGILVRRRRA